LTFDIKTKQIFEIKNINVLFVSQCVQKKYLLFVLNFPQDLNIFVLKGNSSYDCFIDV